MKDDNIIICGNCYKENEAGRSHCLYCGKNLYYNAETDVTMIKEESKINDNKQNKNEMANRNITKLIAITICIGIIVIIAGITIWGIKQETQYNNDLDVCYSSIRQDSNWNRFKQKLGEHKEDTKFSSEAYNNLFKAVDERIESIKKGNNDSKLTEMLDTIRKENIKSDVKKEIVKKYYISKSYNNINEVNEYISKNEYIEAYELLDIVISDIKDRDTKILEIATDKQNEIKDKTFQQLISKAQKLMKNKDYSSVQTTLSKYKDLGNKTILDTYNKATKEVERIEKEEKAKEEAERKKREEAERKREQEKLKAKKDKVIVDTDGKRIYKVCMRSNRFSINGTFKGEGHFSVKLLDDNQDLYDLLVNEIGDYVVNKSVRVTEGEYYYLQIECTRGRWSLSWSGTYGD